MKITETAVIKIKGLKRKYTFLHMSDSHIAYSYPSDTEEEKIIAEKQSIRWNESSIPPVDAFQSALILTEEEKPDALIIAGDCVDYFSESNLKFIKEKIKNLNTEVLYVFGNHECSFFTTMHKKNQWYYRYYKKFMSESPDFWVKDYGEFLIIGIDDSDKKNITQEQIEKLESQISRNIPIILVIHIPLLIAEMENRIDSYFFIGTKDDPVMTKKFCELVKKPDNNIVAIIAGHLHFSNICEFSNGRMQYISAPVFKGYIGKIDVCPE